MTNAREIENRVLAIGTDTIFTVNDLGFPREWHDNVRMKLSRMVCRGRLEKTSRGKYFKSRSTVFGKVGPSREELLKDLYVKDGKPIGYPTGYSVWNQMGLTTQVSSAVEIGSNSHRIDTKRGIYNIRFILQPNPITKKTIPLLQILDAFRFIKKIPDTNINNSISCLKSIIRELDRNDMVVLSRLAMRYPPRTRALVGAIIDDLGDVEISEKLYNSLNPSTRFPMDISERVLPNKTKWNICDATPRR